MDLNAWKTFAEMMESFVKAIGITVAGFWAYRKLFLQAEHETSISSALQVKILPYSTSEHLKVIEIRTTLTNRGKVPCQIDLAHSTARVSAVVVSEDTQNEQLTWGCQPLYNQRLNGLLNIPVGAAKDEVQFVPVPHPGTYHVCTFFAQTEEAVRQFYRRMGHSLPSNFRENPSGWANETIISTDASQTAKVETDDEDTLDGV
jgi:hypothetical protein